MIADNAREFKLCDMFSLRGVVSQYMTKACAGILQILCILCHMDSLLSCLKLAFVINYSSSVLVDEN